MIRLIRIHHWNTEEPNVSETHDHLKLEQNWDFVSKEKCRPMNIGRQQIVSAMFAIWMSVTSVMECLNQEVGFHQTVHLPEF